MLWFGGRRICPGCSWAPRAPVLLAPPPPLLHRASGPSCSSRASWELWRHRFSCGKQDPEYLCPGIKHPVCGGGSSYCSVVVLLWACCGAAALRANMWAAGAPVGCALAALDGTSRRAAWGGAVPHCEPACHEARLAAGRGRAGSPLRVSCFLAGRPAWLLVSSGPKILPGGLPAARLLLLAAALRTAFDWEGSTPRDGISDGDGLGCVQLRPECPVGWPTIWPPPRGVPLALRVGKSAHAARFYVAALLWRRFCHEGRATAGMDMGPVMAGDGRARRANECAPGMRMLAPGARFSRCSWSARPALLRGAEAERVGHRWEPAAMQGQAGRRGRRPPC